MICLATPRLLLRTWRAEDGGELGELFGGDRPVIGNIDEREVAGVTPAEIIDRLLTAWAEDGYGVFAVEAVDGGRVVGLAGLVPGGPAPDESRAPSVVWRMTTGEMSPAGPVDDAPSTGLAVEAMAALVDWAFGLFDIEAISAWVDGDAEVTAGAVLAAVGMNVTSRTIDPERHVWVTHFSITVSQWRKDER